MHSDPRIDAILHELQQLKEIMSQAMFDTRSHIDRTVDNTQVTIVRDVVHIIDKYGQQLVISSYPGRGNIRAEYIEVNGYSPDRIVMAEIIEELTLKAWKEWQDKKGEEKSRQREIGSVPNISTHRA